MHIRGLIKETKHEYTVLITQLTYIVLNKQNIHNNMRIHSQERKTIQNMYMHTL